MTATVKNRGAYEAIVRGSAASSNRVAVEGYPEDTVDMIRKVCELWNLRPPERKVSKAYWIASARELMEACGEFGVFCLERVRIDFVRVMEDNQKKGMGGVAPYIVEGPGSLIKMARAKAGELRNAAVKKPTIVTTETDEDVFEEYQDKLRQERSEREKLAQARLEQVRNRPR